MMHRSLLTPLVIAVSLGSLAFAGQAQARDLRMAPGVPPAHPAYDPMFTEFAERLAEKTDGELTGNLLGTEVANIGNMRNALRSGMVEVGLFLPAYFPADLPEFNLVGDLALLGTNPHAMGAAMTEYIVTCGECQQELKKLGIVYTSSHASDLYRILSTEPASSLDDLQGLRMRVGGPQYSRWAEAMGISPASIPVGEQYEALSQGVIEGTIASVADIISFRLDDVLNHITDIQLGTFHSTISHAVGQQAWDSFSPEQRKAVVESSVEASAAITQRWGYEMADEAREIAQESDIEILEPDPELLDATEAFLEEDLTYAAEQAENRYGVEDAASKIERFQGLVEKWTGIVEDVGEEPEAVAEAMEREIWSQVDFSSYGT
ncbi:TRAP transporter substrate-binding protein DctP [Halomonas elongata]|uniref:TRAP transporter substrate-binding protein DctP n=2 Tax=Halomonas elongata (strain ATCC 33173 / DSM 2581 / NBRC 15536 / NCIMB 2198 / 1H9) TaxID=768066 RepID=A0ABZ0T534_HALED|nr:TRAP transporter substrate-binding protein DctP [Halomonas elongata]WBF17572.1 TRAP transporter substrate-binding protein DctP [Halomonas elongata]WPU46411.1 TRAP transporter substrate-binding protein DctP [Halomonas elongata DSM 2581]